MKKLLLLSALTLGIACGASAQSPGYMGMRFFLKPEFSSTVAFSNPTANNKGGQNPYTGDLKFGLNTRYGIQAGYVLSRRSVVVAEGSYTKTGMLMYASTPSLAFPNGGQDQHTLFYNLGGPELGVGIQTYATNRGSLAPLGPFFAARARFSFLKGEVFDHKIDYSGDNGSVGHGPLGIDPRYTHLALGIEFGTHHIVADHILLGISAEFNLGFRNLFSSASSTSENQDVFIDTASRRMNAHSIFFFKIGAGYLF